MATVTTHEVQEGTVNQRASREPVLVCLQLSGGNDFMNTVIPYGEGHYYDFRRTTRILQGDVLAIDGQFGFHPAMGPIKELWDDGRVAIINGVGYPEPNRSHFRSMDIWHTAEPSKQLEEGWLGKAIRDLDPNRQNVVTGVSFGIGLPRAMYLRGTPVMAVSELEDYGMVSSLAGKKQRQITNTLTRLYAPEEIEEKDLVFGHLEQTGRDALTGAELLRSAPDQYESSVSYRSDVLSQSLRGIAQVHLAGLGTRVFYAEFGGFDVHSRESQVHQELWETVSCAVSDFFADLRSHHASEEVVMLVFSEFGRRIRDNGNGTDHGSGGGALLIGDRVFGGMYGDYPSLEPSRQLNGDMHFTNDFRSLYSSILEQWFGLPPRPIVNGRFDQFDGIVAPLAAERPQERAVGSRQ